VENKQTQNAANQPGEKAEGKLVKTTLKELGPNLPLGVPQPDGSLATGIDVRPWRMKEEKELGSLREERRGDNVAKYVSVVLSAMCNVLGSHKLSEMQDITTRLIHISQLFMCDAFYAYFWLRYKALGPHLAMEINCPSCSNKFDFTADLESLEVTTVKSLDDAMWDYKLRDPFEIRGKVVEGFKMGPARWNAIETGKGAGMLDTGAAKHGIIHGSIHSILGLSEQIALMDTELDDMSKYDLEKLTSTLEDKAVGPDMAIEDKCPKCKRTFRTTIDWSYDNFFGISSR